MRFPYTAKRRARFHRDHRHYLLQPCAASVQLAPVWAALQLSSCAALGHEASHCVANGRSRATPRTQHPTDATCVVAVRLPTKQTFCFLSRCSMYTFSEHQHQCRYSREIGCTRRGYAIDALHHRVGASIREDSRSCAAFPGAESRSGTLRGLPPARHAYPNERA